MRLGIFCNFSYKHIGGSEFVIKQISDILSKIFKYDVMVYSHSCKNPFSDNGVNYSPCLRGDRLIHQINDNDHIFVYSDSFWGWDTIVENIDKVVPDVSVALVGAYHMREHNRAIADKFIANINRFRAIVHSNGTDQKWCVHNRIPYRIIPNGVDLSEFRNNSINFRKKYNIKEKYILLNVASYFYGKGQETLPKIYKKLRNVFDDFVILSISNTVQYPYDKIFLDRTKNQSKGMNIRFLRDVPREDVVAAFNASDIFVFTSRKEVSPLVILESQASNTPWVSFDVGDVKDRAGGVVVKEIKEKDHKGYNVIDDNAVDRFCIHVAEMFNIKGRIERKIEEGQKNIDKLDWNNIVPLYNEVFEL